MTEITRVPLQPIAKGSLTKLWLAVIAAVLLAAGLAWYAMPRGVTVETITEGTGPAPEMGQVVFVKYVGKLRDGTEFDRSRPLPIPPGVFPDGTPMLLEEGALVQGFLEGVQKMKKGGKYLLEIPAADAYGENPPPGSNIPPNSDLLFEVEVVDYMARNEFEQRAAALQQFMEQGAKPDGSAGPDGFVEQDGSQGQPAQ